MRNWLINRTRRMLEKQIVNNANRLTALMGNPTKITMTCERGTITIEIKND